MYTVLIADDEMVECEGIDSIVKERFPQLTVLPFAFTGEELIEGIQKHEPDIVIADINMPGMSGLDALEKIHEKSKKTKIIINTAYSYFEYAKRALSLRAEDYLVKPVEKETFCLVMTKVIVSLNEERKSEDEEVQEKKSIRKILDVAGKEVLSSVILGHPNKEECDIWLEHMGHIYWGSFFVAGQILSGEHSGEQLAKIQMLSEEYLNMDGTTLNKLYHNRIVWFFFPGEKIQSNHYKKWVSEKLKDFQEEVKNEGLGDMVFGVSRWHYDYEDVYRAYLEAVSSLGNTCEKIRIAFPPEKDSDKIRQIEVRKISCFIEYIMTKDMKQIKQYLCDLFRQWKEENIPETEQRVLLLWILQECSRRICGYNIYSWNQINMIAAENKDEEELAESLAETAEYFENLENESDGKIQYVRGTLDYIKEHFTEDISLDMAAETLGISSFYLSRLLTQKIQSSFMDLLTSERIEKAIQLIRKPDAVSGNIGLRVGYQSVAYFYRAFKKNTGMTVGEMRGFLGRVIFHF